MQCVSLYTMYVTTHLAHCTFNAHLFSHRRTQRALYLIISYVREPYRALSLIRSIEALYRGNFISFSSMQGNPLGHISSTLQGHPLGHCSIYYSLERHSRGFCIVFSLLKGHFIKFPMGTGTLGDSSYIHHIFYKEAPQKEFHHVFPFERQPLGYLITFSPL